MSDDKMTESRPVDTVKVTVIGTGDASHLASGVVAVTPGVNQPNLVTQVVTPIVAIGVRFGYDWCTAFVGTMIAGGVVDHALPHAGVIALLKDAAVLASCMSGVGLARNAATVFSGLEKRFPLASGNV